MQGFDTLWLPWYGPWGIALKPKLKRVWLRTASLVMTWVVKNSLEKVWEWKRRVCHYYQGTMGQDGALCGLLTSERFALRDEGLSKRFRKVFVELYKKGWIYRRNLSSTGIRKPVQPFLISRGYSQRCRRCLLPHELHVGKTVPRALEAKQRHVLETMFGDTAVASTPNDDRYKDFDWSKCYLLPILNKVSTHPGGRTRRPWFVLVWWRSPAHDPNDFLVGQRHNLPQERYERWCRVPMNELAGESNGIIASPWQLLSRS